MIDALSLIRGFEGFRETPYWDVNALRTGYGSDTVTLPDGTVQPVTDATRVTREDADRDLARRVQTEFIPRARAAIGPDVFDAMTPDQQAALASITYNYGSLPDSVAQAARSGDPAVTAEAIRALSSHNGGVNADRRAKEADIFAGKAGDSQPSDRNPIRLAMAYASGKMSPEDEALYEQGVADGVFPEAKKKGVTIPQDTALQDYAMQIQARKRQSPPQLQQIGLQAVTNATPYSRFSGLGV